MDDPLQVARSAANSGTPSWATSATRCRWRSLLPRERCRSDCAASRASRRHAPIEFLESAHAPELRIIVEQWLAGELDFLDAVIFSRTDESAQRIYYYLCELQRRGLCGGPRPLLFDLAKIARPTSIEHSRESTRRLAEELGSEGCGPCISRTARCATRGAVGGRPLASTRERAAARQHCVAHTPCCCMRLA